MNDAFTSDGQPRPNYVALARALMPTIPYMIDWSQRVVVLHDLAVAAGVPNPIDIAAAYSNSDMTQRVNDISREVGGLPIYDNIDINSFNSVIGNIVETMAGQ